MENIVKVVECVPKYKYRINSNKKEQIDSAAKTFHLTNVAF
jgi:hypothetical protein